MQLSTGLATGQNTYTTGQLTGGFIRLFSGAPPASPDLAETGTLLGVVSVEAVTGAGLHYEVAGAIFQKPDEVWGFKALATGTVGWFRVVAPGDTGADSLTAVRIDGTVGTADAAGDMNWASLDVTVGLFYTIDSFLYLIQPVTGE